MKRKRFIEGQIIDVLKEHELGAKTSDLCRKHGICINRTSSSSFLLTAIKSASPRKTCRLLRASALFDVAKSCSFARAASAFRFRTAK